MFKLIIFAAKSTRIDLDLYVTKTPGASGGSALPVSFLAANLPCYGRGALHCARRQRAMVATSCDLSAFLDHNRWQNWTWLRKRAAAPRSGNSRICRNSSMHRATALEVRGDPFAAAVRTPEPRPLYPDVDRRLANLPFLFTRENWTSNFMCVKNTPKTSVKNFIEIFPHRILIHGIMPAFGRIRRKSGRKALRTGLSQGLQPYVLGTWLRKTRKP